MKFRFLLLSMLVIVLMAFGGIATAQDMDMACFGLDAGDCEVLMSASANEYGDATSMTMTTSLLKPLITSLTMSTSLTMTMPMKIAMITIMS